MKSATEKETTMKAIVNTGLVGLITVAVNLIGLIALAAAASVLVGGGAGHRAPHSPNVPLCAETCPIHPPSS